jgi:hypothetical protein
MSCDRHPYPAQNKRWLSDKIDELIEISATGESYQDIPLDDRHVRRKRSYQMPREWLRVSPERERASKAIDEQIFRPAVMRAIELSQTSALEFPGQLVKRLKGIVTKTVYNAVRPGVYADLNDPRVREHIVNESLKTLVRSFDRQVKEMGDFMTPDISGETFQVLFQKEQARLKEKERLAHLRETEDKAEALHQRREEYAENNVIDELEELSPAELEKAATTEKDEETKSREEELNELGLDPKIAQALKLREERRKVILSRLDEPEVPEWLKHAVDTEDKDFFPMASGRFNSEDLTREDILSDFFQRELDDAEYGSEKEAKLLELLEDFIGQEGNEMIEEEPIDAVKRRVNAVLKEIEDREEVQNAKEY